MSSSLKKNNPESALTCVDRDHAFFWPKIFNTYNKFKLNQKNACIMQLSGIK